MMNPDESVCCECLKAFFTIYFTTNILYLRVKLGLYFLMGEVERAEVGANQQRGLSSLLEQARDLAFTLAND